MFPMAKGDGSNRVLLVDDEPEYIAWIAEFIQTRGLSSTYALTLPEALQTLVVDEFRLIIVDMNIPAREALPPALLAKIPLVRTYPGIAVAVHARNVGYGAHSVIAYTVHDDDAADRELNKLHCRYVLKGRPKLLKQAIEKSLQSPG